MMEVTIRLRFTNYSLGDRRFKRISRMLQDGQGRIVYLPTWWDALMGYAAKVLNKYHELARQIDWDPVVDGRPTEYRRYYDEGKYTLHEAFEPGAEIGVNAVLPTGLTIEMFTELLDVAGRYRGISPYRQQKQYGTFEVVSVVRRQRVLPADADPAPVE